MTVQKILIPQNFSQMDAEALAFVVRTFGHLKDVTMTLFHLYTPIPDIDTPSETVMGRLSASMQFLSSQLRDKEDSLRKSRNYLIANGIDGNRADYIFRSRVKSIADEIIDTFNTKGFNTIVLSCKSSRITRLFIQSVHQKVIASLSGATICIVT